jgi:hypothetical protein
MNSLWLLALLMLRKKDPDGHQRQMNFAVDKNCEDFVDVLVSM